MRIIDGLIPARAGNTYPCGGGRVAPGAHPRSRGEHWAFTYESQVIPGSSPLARGTRPGLSRRGDRQGLIPARAGNTRVWTLEMTTLRAHPRSRGEH